MRLSVIDLAAAVRAASGPDGRARLADVAKAAGYSTSQTRRLFAAALGETPSQFQRRVRLDRAAAQLLLTNRRLVDIALESGFSSHEGFTRAFASLFGQPPSSFRRRGSWSERAEDWISPTSPCVRMLRTQRRDTREDHDMQYNIHLETIAEAWVIVGRQKVDRARVSEALAELIPPAFGHAVAAGLEIVGPPFARYLSESAAFFELQAGVPIAGPTTVDADGLSIEALPAGRAATTVHEGPYESLGDAHIALDRWMHEKGLRSGGGPWEIYLTDPAEVPDPAEWRTKICWPIAETGSGSGG